MVKISNICFAKYKYFDLESDLFFLNENKQTRRMPSVARRGEFSRFVGFLAQKGGQIFEDGDLWELFKKGGILKNFTKIGKFSYFSTKC